MLPFRSGRSGNWGFFFMLGSLLLINDPAGAAKPKKQKQKLLTTATPTASPGEQSLTNIPLPIGHEAKGLVLPDYDKDGHLVGRFEAGTARRIDQEHVQFQSLKITTFTPQNKIDLQIDMQTSVFNLNSHVLVSKE